MCVPKKSFIFIIWFAVLSSSWAAPTNDNFSAAENIIIQLPLPNTVTGNTTGATIEAEETAIDATYAASVWYKVTAPVDGIVQIDTQGSDYSTRLAVVVGNDYATLLPIVFDDNPADGTSVIFAIQNGVEYRIAVFGVGGATGNLSLNLRETQNASISGIVSGPSSSVTVQLLRYNSFLGEWLVISETATNGIGGYTFANLEIGANYRVRAVDSTHTYASIFSSGSTLVSDALSVTPDPDLLTTNITMPLASTISGQVSGTSGGLDNITVKAFIWSNAASEWQLYASTTSGSDGSYSLAGLAPATYHLSFSDDLSQEYLTGYYDAANTIGTAQDIVVVVNQTYPNRDITLVPTGQILGTATLQTSGQAVAGILVQAFVWDAVDESWIGYGNRVATALDGTYTIKGLPHDTYKVAFASFDDALLVPGFYGGGQDPSTATSVVLSSGSPVSSSIDYALSPMQISSITDSGSNQYTMNILGNPYAQFVVETSTNLTSWESRGLPFNLDLGPTTHLVGPESASSKQFWRLRGMRDFELTADPSVHDRSSYAIAQERYRWILRSNYFTGPYFLAAYGFGDFDGDGNTDVLSFPGEFLTKIPVPCQLKLDIDGAASDGSSIFQVSVPGALHPRKLLVGDLNGDSVDDAVLIDHGYDADSFPGAPLQVLLSTGDGKITTTIYSDHTGFHHAGALGDIDHDGDLDLFLASSPWQSKPHLILLNDGSGAFTPAPQLMGDIWSGNIFASEFFDLDGDGFLDLAIGGSIGADPAVLLWGSSSGTYGGSSLNLDLPDGWSVYDFEAEDLDGDGDRDLLVNLSNDTTSAYQLRLFINQGNRSFVDETGIRIDNPGNTGADIDFTFIQDVDADLDLDIVAEFSGALVKWVNDGSGNFNRQP